MALESRFPEFGSLTPEDQAKLEKKTVTLTHKGTWTDSVKSDMLDSAATREYGDKLVAVGSTTDAVVETTAGDPPVKVDTPTLTREYYVSKG